MDGNIYATVETGTARQTAAKSAVEEQSLTESLGTDRDTRATSKLQSDLYSDVQTAAEMTAAISDELICNRRASTASTRVPHFGNDVDSNRDKSVNISAGDNTEPSFGSNTKEGVETEADYRIGTMLDSKKRFFGSILAPYRYQAREMRQSALYGDMQIAAEMTATAIKASNNQATRATCSDVSRSSKRMSFFEDRVHE